jgi:hypothetical protein
VTDTFSQSQVIEPSYFSTDKKSKRRLERKADFTLSYSHESPGFAKLYARLLPYNSAVSHMSDAFTKTTAVFAGIEAKAANGDKSEAEYQLSIFMAGSLRKKAELARTAGVPDTTLLIEPAFVVVGHEWYFYLAYLQPNGAVHILEHGSCSTSSVSGVCKILKLLRNVIEYALEGVGEDDGVVGFWGGFLGLVLERLANGNANGIVMGNESEEQGDCLIGPQTRETGHGVRRALRQQTLPFTRQQVWVQRRVFVNKSKTFVIISMWPWTMTEQTRH